MNYIWRSRFRRYLIEPAKEALLAGWKFASRRPKRGKDLLFWKYFMVIYSVLGGVWLFIIIVMINGGA